MDIKPKDQCKWDLVALGEVMLRLDPGDRRVSTARSFDVWEGGGEYNVARGLKRCFGLDTAIATALVDNPVGRLLQDLIYQGGVDQSLIRWVPDDGVGRAARNGLNFTERGFGVRGALGCSDRGHTAISQVDPTEFKWDEIFGKQGARWFHTGGIFCALSEKTPEVAIAAIEAARRHGTIVSYDLNYRPSLWKSIGGKQQAQAVNRRIAPLVDVMFGNEEDFSACLGCEVEAAIQNYSFKVIARTERHTTSATRNDWSAICYADGILYESTPRKDMEIYDRVGGGDSFAAGLIYGLLTGESLPWSLECGAAHGALAMTTPGDTSMATLEEVLRVMKGASPRIIR